jgi:hypothetical protein
MIRVFERANTLRALHLIAIAIGFLQFMKYIIGDEGPGIPPCIQVAAAEEI